MDQTQRHLWRSRWAAIGAAVAVTLGTGGVVTTFADSPASSLVAISPVRVLDTRLGGFGGSLVSAVPRLLDVTGTISTVSADGRTVAPASVVPDGATAIVANVTIVEPTTPGFVSVRPGTATGTPTTSSLNASAPGVIVPNSVTVEIPTTGATAGQLQLFFQGTTPNATTDLLVDIVGYYQAGASPGGLSYVGSFEASATVGIGPDFPPLPPNGYTATFNLGPGRYSITGDVTIVNNDAANEGIAVCQLFVNDTAIGRGQSQEIGPLVLDGALQTVRGMANVSFAQTHQITTGGQTTISFRCARLGSTSMSYTELNMTVLEVG